MRMKKYVRSAITCVLIITLITINGCHKSSNTPSNPKQTAVSDTYETAMHTAETTPFGRYPEELTYTLGKLSGANNSNLPEGETYEDNAYTRLLNEKLNVQNDDVFEAMDDQYTDSVATVIAQKNLPDIMSLSTSSSTSWTTT